jgi:hypothetical protein
MCLPWLEDGGWLKIRSGDQAAEAQGDGTGEGRSGGGIDARSTSRLYRPKPTLATIPRGVVRKSKNSSSPSKNRKN